MLYRVLFHYFEQFLAEYESRFEREHGFFLTDHAGGDRIINHLKLTFVAERPPSPHMVSQAFLMDSEAPAEYFS
ncbi:MAG: hypothetical protein ACLFVG_05490 [Candidatus Aminicenantes bacterium]